jgi:uncharacterized protein (TIGR02001 family)
MRTSMLGLTAVALAALASPALAQDAPASPFTVSGGATVTTDYRFRGVSQSDKRFAVQGTINVAHESGFYVGTWGSTIDDYVANGGDAEIDLYGGYKRTFGGTTADIGLLYYYYPGSGGITSDFAEPYVSLSHTVGPVAAKIGAAYAPKQHGLAYGRNNREDNLYLYGEGSFAVPDTGLSLSAHVGHSNGRSYLTNGLKEYWDWNVGASYAWKGLTFGVSYVDNDIKDREFELTSGRHPAKGGVLGSIGAAF